MKVKVLVFLATLRGTVRNSKLNRKIESWWTWQAVNLAANSQHTQGGDRIMVTILDKILKWMLKANLEYKYNTVMMKIMCLFWLEHKLNFRSIQSCQICFDCCGSKLSY